MLWRIHHFYNFGAVGTELNWLDFKIIKRSHGQMTILDQINIIWDALSHLSPECMEIV